MGVQVWPSVLPIPSQAYSVDPEPVVTRRVMDSGRSRQLPSSTVKIHFVQVAWEFTDMQMELFTGFYNVALRSGTYQFSMDLAIGGGACLPQRCKFTGDYKVNNSGSLNWKVSAQLEILSNDGFGGINEAGVTSHVIDFSKAITEPSPIVSGSKVDLGLSTLESDST